MKTIKNFFSILKDIDFNKFWILFFIFIFIGILYACMFASGYTFNPLLLIILTMSFILLLTILYKKLFNKYNNLSNKSTWIFFFSVSIIMMIIEFIIGYLVRTNPSWDLGIVIKSAKEIIKYGHSTTQSGYYIQAPNNIIITLIIALSLKFFNLFNIHNVNLITLTINILFIQLAILFMFKLAKYLFNNITACFSLVLTMLFLPLYPYATICYTDTTSMFLPVCILYALIKLENTSNFKYKILYSILLGFLSFLGFGLKVTSLIVLIAYIIICIFNGTIIKKLKYLAIAFITFLLIFKSYVFFINKTNIIGMPYSETQAIPFTHFVMMGMTGSGAFSAEEWQYTFSFHDYNSRKDANINVIKNRLSNYKTQGYIKFLTQKVVGQTWADGTYDFETILNSYNIDNNIAHQFLLNTGKYFIYVFYYCQTYHFSMLICILILFIYSLKKNVNNYIKVCQLSFLGLLLFLLIWETRSRYMLNYIPIFILLFTSGIKYLSNDLNKIFSRFFLKNR